MRRSGSHNNRIWADMEFAPGEHELIVLLPPSPTKCRVDDMPAEFKYDRHWRTAHVPIRTPSQPHTAMSLEEGQSWVENVDPALGNWIETPLRPLEDLGPIPYGYVKYRAEFSYNGQPKMFMATFADDAKKVFLNGTLVREASNARKQVEFSLAGYAQSETNTIGIIYELFGSPNVGDNLGELKGVESLRYGADVQSSVAINSWRIQRMPAAMRGREIDPQFSVAGWTAAVPRGTSGPQELVPSFTWYRAQFTIPQLDGFWFIPWKLTFEAERLRPARYASPAR